MTIYDRIMKGDPYCLYVLELQNGKYYVGMSSNVNWRIIEHQRGKTTKFVKQHLPVKDWRVFNIGLFNERAVMYLETALTIKLIWKHGIENVYGGFLVGHLEYRKKLYRKLNKSMRYSVLT